VTRDQETNEYAIVTAFQNGGNLKQVISENHTDLTWLNVFMMLKGIISGLDHIHSLNYHHKDLHSGNSLNKISGPWNFSMISDFGMCRPAD